MTRTRILRAGVAAFFVLFVVNPLFLSSQSLLWIVFRVFQHLSEVENTGITKDTKFLKSGGENSERSSTRDFPDAYNLSVRAIAQAFLLRVLCVLCG